MDGLMQAEELMALICGNRWMTESYRREIETAIRDLCATNERLEGEVAKVKAEFEQVCDDWCGCRFVGEGCEKEQQCSDHADMEKERDSLKVEIDESLKEQARMSADFIKAFEEFKAVKAELAEFKAGVRKKWWRWNNSDCQFECLHCEAIQARQVLRPESFPHIPSCLVRRCDEKPSL